VIAGLNDDQFIIGSAMDQTVLVIDPPGPEARKIAAQRLRFASALERAACVSPWVITPAQALRMEPMAAMPASISPGGLAA
jgi:hypothetical protein